jgi:hypothetical protein
MKRWKSKHLDVKNAFLHGDLKEKVSCYSQKDLHNWEKNKRFLPFEGILWLGANIKAWYTKIDNFLPTFGLIHSKLNHNLYFLIQGDWYVVMILYVDNLLLTGDNIRELEILEQNLNK